MTYTWRPVKIGGGGMLTGISMSDDGVTKLVRADTFGAFILNNTTGIWDQLCTTARLPSPYYDVSLFYYKGVYAAEVAPSDSTRIYMSYLGYIFKSTNAGATFTLATPTGSPLDMAPNTSVRMANGRMAIDPANADIVYLTTDHNGVYKTTNGGTSWSQISTGTLPVNGTVDGGAYTGLDGNGGTGTIVFDRNSGTTGGATNTIYISVYGIGTYRSTNAGSSWTLLTGLPATYFAASVTGDGVICAKVAADGVYYCVNTDYDAGASKNYVWKYASGAWTDISPGGQISGIVCDPSSAAHVSTYLGGYLNDSTNRGVSWGGLNLHHTRVATDCPWLAVTVEDFMGDGDMVYDPVVSGKIWFVEGIGVWTSTTPIQASPTPQVWTSITEGIEQLPSYKVLCPPGNSNPIFCVGDRGVIRVTNPDAFTAVQKIDTTVNLNASRHADWASSDPTYIAALCNSTFERSGYSSDGGANWTQFTTAPTDATFAGGTLAVSTPTNIVWVPGSNKDPWYTKNGGTTWTKIAISGVPVEGPGNEPGWGNFYYYFKHNCVCADRVTANTFYLYNTGQSASNGPGSSAGVYKSTNSGDTWTKVYDGNILSYVYDFWGIEFQSVPDHAGHLFFSHGHLGSPYDGLQPFAGLYFNRSTDGGVTWTNVPNVLEVFTYGFGAVAPGGSYPTMCIAGWVNQGSGYEYGIWQSDNAHLSTPTWTKLPVDTWADEPVTIDGDKSVYGKWYVGFQGSSFRYASIDVATGPVVHFRLRRV